MGTYTKVVDLPFHHINSQIAKWSVLPWLSFVADASARTCSNLKLVPAAFAFCGNETITKDFLTASLSGLRISNLASKRNFILLIF